MQRETLNGYPCVNIKTGANQKLLAGAFFLSWEDGFCHNNKTAEFVIT